MLFESISYRDELPFELSFLNIAEESKHCHKEIEIVLVLRGVTHYQIYHTDYELNPGDLIIADVEDLHQIHNSSEDILLLSLHVDTGRFEQLYPNIRYMFFVCEECMEGPSGNKQLLQNQLTLLKHCIAKLAFDYDRESQNTALLTEEINELVSILVTHFQGFFMEDYQYKTSQENMSPEDLRRFSRITRYIMLNYKEKITLDDVSKMEHLSSYYVSHLIKKSLGFNFQNFLNAIRLEFAEKLLVFSNMTLLQISQECGFSSPNYFNKCFSAWHGKTPAQYRKAYVPCQRSCKDPFTTEEAFALLSSYLNISKTGSELPRLLSIAPDFSAPFLNFREACAPRIIIDSLDAALKLSYYREKIQRIRPAALILDEDLGKHNPELVLNLREMLEPLAVPILSAKVGAEDHAASLDAAAAFELIFSPGNRSMFLLGEKQALFTPQGLETPLYTAWDYLADFDAPQILIQEDHVLIKSRDTLAVLVFNTSAHLSLDVHIAVKGLPPKAILLLREFSPHHSCYVALEALGNPPSLSPLLKKRIRQHSKGKTFFMQPEAREDSDINFILNHNTAAILEIL